jgi:S1-C subfamily serine protease
MYIYRDSLGPAFDKARIELLWSRAGLDSLRVHLKGDSLVFFGPDQEWAPFVFSSRAPGEVAVRTYTVGMRAVAGAELQELNPELARYFKVDEGLLVVNAAPSSPARRAGIQAGDVITGADGQKVSTVAQLRRAIERASGKNVKLELVRDGAKKTVELPR